MTDADRYQLPNHPRRGFLRDAATCAAGVALVACAGVPEQAGGSGAGLASSADPQLACPVVTQFPAIIDLGARATFTRMDRGDQFEWLLTGLSAAQYASALPDCVLAMLQSLDRLHFGHPLSLLAHSLQAATRARNAHAHDDLVLAALCHHLGALITIEGQAELSAAILRGFVSENVYRVVRHHEEYQTDVYAARVGLPGGQRERYAREPWHLDAVRFCDEWDCPSYDPSFASLELAAFELLVRAKLGPESGYLVGQLTSTDCV
jgi:predicted HD phosphohydrolase